MHVKLDETTNSGHNDDDETREQNPNSGGQIRNPLMKKDLEQAT